MNKIARIATLRGLSPSDDELTDQDIVEVDGEPPPVSRVSMTCLAATATTYVIVAPRTRSERRRETLRHAG
jgi:hypothetical protein